MKNVQKNAPLVVLLLLCTTVLMAQYTGEHSEHQTATSGLDMTKIFGLLELPFLLVCVFYSFRTAGALKGGIFGKGMTYLAWGFLVMAVGHLAMQVHHIFGFDIFTDTLGEIGGNIAWFVALIITWGLSAFGFYKIYKVSKKG